MDSSSQRIRNDEFPVLTPVRLPKDQNRKGFEFPSRSVPIETLAPPEASRVFSNFSRDVQALMVIQSAVHPSFAQNCESVPILSCVSPDRATAEPIYRTETGDLGRDLVPYRRLTSLACSCMSAAKPIQARTQRCSADGTRCKLARILPRVHRARQGPFEVDARLLQRHLHSERFLSWATTPRPPQRSQQIYSEAHAISLGGEVLALTPSVRHTPLLPCSPGDGKLWVRSVQVRRGIRFGSQSSILFCPSIMPFAEPSLDGNFHAEFWSIPPEGSPAPGRLHGLALRDLPEAARF